jgi:hypothetical protein
VAGVVQIVAAILQIVATLKNNAVIQAYMTPSIFDHFGGPHPTLMHYVAPTPIMVIIDAQESGRRRNDAGPKFIRARRRDAAGVSIPAAALA